VGGAFVITLREGLEAALVIAILLAYLNRIGRREDHRKVWIGAGLASVVSVAAGAVIFAVAGGLSHRAAEAFEGVTTLVAVGFVTWMIFWMRRHAANIKAELAERVEGALSLGGALALPLVAFFVVVREGLETALFLFSAFKAGEVDPAVRTTGAVLGLVVALVLGYLFYQGGIKLNLRVFFRVTGVFLILIAATLVRYGLHELYEAAAFGFLSGTFLLEKVPVIGVISNIPSQILVGLKGNPNWLEFIAWATYLGLVGYLFLRPAAPKLATAGVAPGPAHESIPAEANDDTQTQERQTTS
jgi:high-affinity iron transporter